MKSSSLSSLDSHKADQLLQSFIETDTQNPPGNESRLAKKIHDFLQDAGRGNDNLSLKLVPCEESGRESLLACLKGRGQRRPIILCGHMDTVLIGDVRQWKYAPDKFSVSQGLAYGRGTSDMKSGLAAIVYAFSQAAASGEAPAGDIYLAATADEESNGMGAAALAPYLPLDDATVYIAEPTNNDIGVCSKGTLWLQVECSGKTAHGAYPERGINAIEGAYQLYQALQSLCQGYQYDLLGQTTCTITGIRGGVKTNMVADACTMTLDIRTTPDVSNGELLEQADGIIEKLMTEKEGLQISYKILNDRSAVSVDQDSEDVAALFDIIKRETGKEAVYKGIKFFSDASVFLRFSPQVTCIQFGPGREDNAHIVDEYVELDHYYSSIRCYHKLLEQYFI